MARKSVTWGTLGSCIMHILAAQLKVSLARHVHTCLAVIKKNIIVVWNHTVMWSSKWIKILLIVHWMEVHSLFSCNFLRKSIKPVVLSYYAEWFCMNCKISEQILKATSKCFLDWTLYHEIASLVGIIGSKTFQMFRLRRSRLNLHLTMLFLYSSIIKATSNYLQNWTLLRDCFSDIRSM